VPPVRVAVAPPLALPEREPRNILLMIALPALLVGIIGTLVVMYTSGVRSLQSGFFPMVGLVGFGALMFSGRFDRGRRISWGEQEKQRRMYLRQLDDDRDEVQRAAQDQRQSQLFVHGDPQELDTVIGGPRMWERRPADADFLDVRLGIGVQSAADSAVSLQWPEVPVGEELEPVTGRALRDFILEQSKIRGIGKVLSLRSRPGFSFVGEDPDELHALMRAVLCSLAVYHSPNDVKLMVVTRHPELWSWLVWLPHNQHDEMFDACGLRRLVFTSPTEFEDALDSDLHRKGRGPWAPPVGSSPTTMLSPMEAASGSTLGPHWVIVDDNVGTPEQWEFYSLVERHHDGRPDMIGMEAVNQLLVALEVHRFDFCFIGAGYEKEVDEFLTVNPGLAGRFNRKLRFESYTPDELVEIAIRYGGPRATVIEPAAQDALNAACRKLRAYLAPDGTHGIDVMQNGRFARNVVERAERLRDSRVAAQNRTNRGSVTVEDLETLRTQDVVAAAADACAEKHVAVSL
jgi:DNA segregation ATPase FtsK/SpoIIIE-like protein